MELTAGLQLIALAIPMADEHRRPRDLPGPVFYAVALFQALGFHVPYFYLPEDPLGTVLSGRGRKPQAEDETAEEESPKDVAGS